MLKHVESYWTHLSIQVLKRYGEWFPDKIYLKLLYRLSMHKRLNLKNPKTFTEKIQWLKLYDRKAKYTLMVDKIKVKEFVANTIGKEYVIPTIGVWNSFEEIDFNSLPESFVLKTNCGGGSGGVIICKNKQLLDINDAKTKINNSLKNNIYKTYREWPYKNIVPQIFAEQYMRNSNDEELRDYKFFCFDGVPKYCQVISNRRTKETIDFYDMNWIHQEFYGLNPKCKQSDISIPKPALLNQMINIAKIFSKNMPFLRVDLYNINNHIYFGELTFYPASGIGTFTPSKWNTYLGNMIHIHSNDNK